MVVVPQRRVEDFNDSARKNGGAHPDDNVSVEQGGVYAVPLQDKRFKLSGETGSYKCAPRNHAPRV